MQQAWVRSVLLHAILWSEPYVKPGDFQSVADARFVER